MTYSVLLDTSFFLRFLNEEDPLYENMDQYYRYFLQENVSMIISTISIAEYCIGGSLNELPLKNLMILPFNISHARRTGEFARAAFQATQYGTLSVENRKIIPNDTKLFAQADIEDSIKFYLTSDSESIKIYNILKQNSKPRFDIIDLNHGYQEYFGIIQF